MNRRQKIIVSVTGIFIVLLALVGITFAYFLTRIQGNNNPTSISVTTANLSLVYADDSSDLITSDKPIIPTFIDTKSFTVTNNGNATVTDYAVILEEYGVTYASDATLTNEDGSTTDVYAGQSTDLKYDDFKLTITCTSYENYGKTGEAVKGTCNGMDGVLPEKSGILLTNNIDAGITHVYELTLEYKETNENQSADMNKTITGKINIMDTKGTVDLTGTVATYNAGDYVQINSEQKISPIYSDGTYKLMGVKPDNHNIKVCSASTETCTEENATSNNDISIVKGESSGVNGNIITINETSRTVGININGQTITIDELIKQYNPYVENSLAYKVYESALNEALGRTLLVTTNGEFIYKEVCDVNKDTEYFVTQPVQSDTDYPCYTGYEVKDGMFTLTGETTCKIVTDEYGWPSVNGFEGKYFPITTGGVISTTSQTTTEYLYEGGVINGCSSGSCDLEGKPFWKAGECTLNNITKELSQTTDNDGTTYYFRGMPEDNYVNFAGKCWRIVRIQGDGSVKLILEDDSQTCSTSMDRNSYIAETSYPYTFDSSTNSYTGDYTQNNGINAAFKTFQNSISSYTGSLKAETWCYGSDGATGTLECKNKTVDKFSDGTTMYVGTLTIEEAKYAGVSNMHYNSSDDISMPDSKIEDCYLLSDYMRNNHIMMWSMTESNYYSSTMGACDTSDKPETAAYIIKNGYSNVSYFNKDQCYFPSSKQSYEEAAILAQRSARPVVVLDKTVTVTGNGTITNPYKVG